MARTTSSSQGPVPKRRTVKLKEPRSPGRNAATSALKARGSAPAPKSASPRRAAPVQTTAKITSSPPRRSRVVLKESAKHKPTMFRKRAPAARTAKAAPVPVAPPTKMRSQPALAAPQPLPPASWTAPPVAPGRSAAPSTRRSTAVEDTFTIPTGYGDTRIVLLVKDPWWIYAYWEINAQHEREVRRQLLPEDIGGVQSILRVYDVTGRNFPTDPPHHRSDIPLSGLAMSWYLHVNAPNRSFIVDIGLLTRDGRFLLLARSNCVTTPRCEPSDILDEAWLTSDEAYWRLFGVTAGIGMGSSASAIKQLLERKLSSVGLFSPGFHLAKSQQPKTFHLNVATELIVHGSTDPKATVTIQGQSVVIRPDGTFDVRMALPDGTQTIPVDATSADRQQTKHVTPTVTQKTDAEPPAELPAEEKSKARARRKIREPGAEGSAR